MCFADRAGIHFAETDATNLAGLDVFCNGSDTLFDRHLRVYASTFEDVDEYLALKKIKAVVDTLLDALSTTIWTCFTESALNAKDDLICVFGMLGEVVAEELKGVGCGWAVEFSAVPKVGAVVESCLHDCGSFVVGSRVRAPREASGEVKSATAMKGCRRST